MMTEGDRGDGGCDNGGTDCLVCGLMYAQSFTLVSVL